MGTGEQSVTDLPGGTVAFLMSDIEGSTRLIEVTGAAFPRLLDEHHRLMAEAVSRAGGRVVSTEGDSVFAVFPSVRAAIGAAIEVQRAHAMHTWPDRATVRVRVGIHAGEAVLRGSDYAGMEVHRTARIMAAAWGGQVLLSEAVRALAGDVLPDGAALHDLGIHQLRDLPRPERLYQLLSPGLETEFPPPRTQATISPTNLPAPLTRFVGRGDEIEELRELLRVRRLVTLTGPGGSGKTRLSIEAARQALDVFPDGAWFVPVDAVRDPELVMPTIAQTLGVPEVAGRSAVDLLAERLAHKRMLLVLDNLEQVIDAALDISRLLAGTTSPVVLASSREPLAVAGEQVFAVRPLTLPAASERPTAADIEGSGAIQLFVERAATVRPDFVLTDANAPVVAAICRRLDGLPLAIELAAARVNVLAPHELLERLDHSLSLLATSRRDLPARQRTLRGTIDWSHDLLTEPERALFRRCAVFAGGMSFPALEAIVDPGGALGSAVLDGVASLVDRNLLRSVAQDGSMRLSMLETIREYAMDRLIEAGEAAELQARHAEYFASLAESHANVLADPRRDEMLDRLDAELGNLRAAIAWSVSTGRTEVGLRLATSLKDFWHVRNHIAEAVRALEDLAAASSAAGESALRARALIVAAILLTWLGERDRSGALAAEGIARAERHGDLQAIAMGKSALGWSTFYRHAESALQIFVEGTAAARAVGDAGSELETLMGQAWTSLVLGRPDDASARAREVIELGEATGGTYITTFALVTLGIVAADRGDHVAALERHREALRRAHAAGAHVGTALALEAIATVLIGGPDVVRGLILASAADGLRGEIGGNVSVSELRRDRPLTRARDLMPPEDYDRAVAQGRQLSVDDAVALALND